MLFERTLGLADETNFKICPKTEVKLQALYKVIKGVREKLRQLETSNEVVSKNALSMKYDSE